MKSHFDPWKWIDFCTIFLSIWIILSIWAGYAGVLSPLAGIVSTVLAFILFRHIKLPSHGPPLKLSLIVFGIIFLAHGFILFGVQGGYDLSADAAPSVATQFITTRIPVTFQPYFDLPFLYQLGLPAIASQFYSLGVSEHLSLWFFAVLGIGFFLFGLIRFGHHLHASPTFLYWIPIVFLGTRLPFFNVFLGEYPLMLALGLGAMSVGLYPRSWKVCGLVLTATVMVHPYIGSLFAILLVLFHRPQLKKLFSILAAGLFMGAPIIIFQIIPFLMLPKTSFQGTEIISIANFTSNILLVGAIPCVLSIFWFLHGLLLRHTFSSNEKKLLILVVSGLALSVFFTVFFPEAILGTKLIVLTLFGTVLLGAAFLSSVVKPAHVPAIALGILIISCVLMATSPSMQIYAMGSKATLEEARFATFVGAMADRPLPVMFLSPGQGKMSQYSRTIPSDPQGAHFTLSLHVLRSEEAIRLREQSTKFKKMLQTRDAEQAVLFLKEYPTSMVVVNRSFFPDLNRNIILQKDNFTIYEGDIPVTLSEKP